LRARRSPNVALKLTDDLCRSLSLTVINDYTSSVGGQPVGKNTEVWVQK
jgi:hypothetical protein